MKLYFGVAAVIVGVTTIASANPYVAGRIGVSDFVVNADQYMYHTPDAYKSTVVDGRIDDINAAYRAAVGYNFGLGRIEAEYGYGHYAMSGQWSLNTKNGVPGSLPPNLSYPANYTLSSNISTFMVNGYYNLFYFGQRYRNATYRDINTPEIYAVNTLYFMAGIGMSHIKEKGQVSIDTTMAWGGDPLHEQADSTANRFTYAVGFGLDFGITDRINAEIGYKYIRMGNYHIGTTKRDYSMHDLMLGLRYQF